MSWFSKEEDYSIHDSGFYGEPEITYGPDNDDEAPESPSSAAGAWEDYQNQREFLSSYGMDDHTH